MGTDVSMQQVSDAKITFYDGEMLLVKEMGETGEAVFFGTNIYLIYAYFSYIELVMSTLANRPVKFPPF